MRMTVKLAKLTILSFWHRHKVSSRLLALFLVVLLIFSIFYQIYDSKEQVDAYSISGGVSTLLGDSIETYANALVVEEDTGSILYNSLYSPGSEGFGDSSSPKISASFTGLPDNSVTVTDPVNNVGITFKPDFDLKAPQKNGNKVIYPISGSSMKKVYTLKASGVKEDIILVEAPTKDEISFDYTVEVPEGLEVRLESDGSLGIYGVQSSLLGNVSATTDSDAELLKKARQNGEKSQLIFSVPAPYVVEKNMKNLSDKVKANFMLDGNKLSLQVSGLLGAEYPLSIDPTIYVETARKLMRGNNESNVDFDVDNDLIQKSQTTGARINEWSSTNNLNSAIWGQGTAVAGGYIYSAGGSTGSTTTTATYYSAGNSSWVVPAGITSVTIKTWGGGGGGGAGSGGSSGGSGGGGGYAKGVVTVVPGNNLSIDVGTGGSSAVGATRGGDGGGFTSVTNTSTATLLMQAGGGAGGGGARGSQAGGDGGAGGGASGTTGNPGGGGTPAGGGSPGSTTSGGSGGAAGASGAAGAAGIANAGGNANGNNCNTTGSGTGGAGGTGGGGLSGTDTSNCANGGGGGGGRFGGGAGGSAATNNRGAGGGGGGSGLATGTGQVNTPGSSTTPGNSSDTERNGAGQGGNGASAFGSTTNGAAGGVVISYTVGTPAPSNVVSWAQFNSANGSIDSPNPGTGVCTGWCSNSVYNLPVALRGLSLVAYNGFLYAIGGSNSSGTPQTSVYIAKLGANGEPQLWHPNGGTPAYWYSDTALSNARSYFGAVAYNNKIYILGGLTTSSTLLSTNTVQTADINPTGTLSTWTTTGTTALTSARYGLSAQVYNGTIYVIGGSTTFTGSPITTVQYVRLNSDGSMNSWIATKSILNSGRISWGGSFSAIWGAYIYVGGGCTAVNGSGYCTAIASDVQIASINADGSLDAWTEMGGAVTNSRIGHTLITWQGGLYRLGGCRVQDASTGDCTNTIFDVDYGVINPAGEVSTVNITEPSGTAPCSGGSPKNCDLPPLGDGAGQGGQMLSATTILNGYLYVIGGCTNFGCSQSSGNVSYVSVGPDGSLEAPSTCSGTSYGAWCVDNTNRVNGTSGVAAAGIATFNNRIYVIGGIDETATGTQRIYYNSTNIDGSLSGAWSSTTFTTAGMTTGGDETGEKAYTYAFARANPASGTNPGNLYIVGGCSAISASAGCANSYNTSVYKCNIASAGSINGCTTTGQLQLDTELADEPNQGLGLHSGTIYAGYIYLIGGFSDNVGDRDTVFYAKIDDSNNIVDAVSGTANPASNDDDWIETAETLNNGRRRGWAFGYNGHIYAVGGYDSTPGVGIIPFIEWSKLDVSSGEIDPFVKSTVEINQRWGLSMTVSNSYAYVIGGCDVGISPGGCSSFESSIQTFQLYNNNSGSVADFTVQSDQTFSDPATENRWGASSTVHNGYLYVAGGCISATDCTTATDSVQYAPISPSDGTIGTWAVGGSLPAVRAWGSLEVVGGSLYYLGGQNSTATNEQSTVYYTTSISAGNPTWSGTAATNGLPAARTKFSSAVWDDRIYVVGGLDGSAAVTNTVYISPKLSSGGNITTAWTTSTAFNVARTGMAVTAYANNLYLFGGFDGTNYLSDSQFTTVGYKTGTISQTGTAVTGTGTTWSAAQVGSILQYPDGEKATITAYNSPTSLTVNVTKTVSAGSIYTIQDGSIGSWSYTRSLPGPLRDAKAVSANGYIYLVGGRSTATSCQPKVVVAPVSANTTIATGNNPTGTGEWYETNVRFAGDRYGAAVAYDRGKIYTMGGGCTAPLSSNRHYLSSVNSQPQVAIYSRMIDTDTDVFPTSWLLNGLDNSIGARWQVRYRSMHDNNPVTGGSDSVLTTPPSTYTLQQNPNEDCGTSATMPVMTTWGQETNFGNVSLGDVAGYTAKNDSGGNINCARYFYFLVSIDASRTFGYPEDVNRGPTISDLSLFFTSDPSKRLRHGKTFTGGEKQPLDTPCRQSVDADCPLP